MLAESRDFGFSLSLPYFQGWLADVRLFLHYQKKEVFLSLSFSFSSSRVNQLRGMRSGASASREGLAPTVVVSGISVSTNKLTLFGWFSACVWEIDVCEREKREKCFLLWITEWEKKKGGNMFDVSRPFFWWVFIVLNTKYDKNENIQELRKPEPPLYNKVKRKTEGPIWERLIKISRPPTARHLRYRVYIHIATRLVFPFSSTEKRYSLKVEFDWQVLYTHTTVRAV